MSESYYIQVRGKRQGPFSVERLRQMSKLGRFGRQHRISTDGRNWQPASEFPHLFEAQGERKTRQTGMAGAAGGMPGGMGAVGADPMAGAAAGAAPGAGAVAGAGMPGAAASQQWFYSHNGQQLGPVTLDTLRQACANKTLKPDDLIWTHGMEEWKRADKAMPGLFSQQAAAVAGGPPAGPGDDGIYAHGDMSNLALYSLILSFVPIIGSIAAIVCGHRALSEINDSNGDMEGRNLALGGLFLGYGVLGLGILGGLYFMSSEAFDMNAGGWTPQMQQSPAAGGDGGGGGDRPGFSQPPNVLPNQPKK